MYSQFALQILCTCSIHLEHRYQTQTIHSEVDTSTREIKEDKETSAGTSICLVSITQSLLRVHIQRRYPKTWQPQRQSQSYNPDINQNSHQTRYAPKHDSFPVTYDLIIDLCSGKSHIDIVGL